MKKVVAIDIDGVLADFEGKLYEVLSAKFGRDRARVNRNRYSIEERYKDDPEMLKFAIDFVKDPNSYHGLPECKGGTGFVESLLDDDYTIFYVTSRPMAAFTFTRRWIVKHITDLDLHLFCGIDDKAGFLKKMGDKIDFVVDDSPQQIAELKKAGFVAVCWAQDWNEGVYPRLYVRSDGEVMLWAEASVEAEPFFVVEIGD